MTTKEKKKQGRPTKYRKEYDDIVIELGLRGLSKNEMAKELGVYDSDVLKDWEGLHESFSRSMRVALQLQSAWYDEKGRKNLNNRQFNSRLYELIRMNMHGWNKKEHQTGKVEHTHSLSALSEQAKKLEEGNVIEAKLIEP